jgi:preprotein translocase subunit SecF
LSEKEDRDLPVQAIHDFLSEIDKGWNRFKTGRLLSIVTTCLLMIMFIPRYFILTIRQPGYIDTMIAVGIVAALFSTIYLSYQQYQFYGRWEKRIELLIHLEKELMGE